MQHVLHGDERHGRAGVDDNAVSDNAIDPSSSEGVSEQSREAVLDPIAYGVAHLILTLHPNLEPHGLILSPIDNHRAI